MKKMKDYFNDEAVGYVLFSTAKPIISLIEGVANNKMYDIITLNFYADNLNKEYNRIKELNICKMSEIMYVNITEPYYYFNIFDPEGNTIEICSNSK